MELSQVRSRQKAKSWTESHKMQQWSVFMSISGLGIKYCGDRCTLPPTNKSFPCFFFQGASDRRQEFSVLHSPAVWELHLLHLTTTPCTVSTTPRTSIFYFVLHKNPSSLGSVSSIEFWIFIFYLKVSWRKTLRWDHLTYFHCSLSMLEDASHPTGSLARS